MNGNVILHLLIITFIRKAFQLANLDSNIILVKKKIFNLKKYVPYWENISCTNYIIRLL